MWLHALQRRWPTALFGSLWLLSALICAGISVTPAHVLPDITQYKVWSRLLTVGGLESAYAPSSLHIYNIDYPPVTLYAYAAVGHLYQGLVDPSFSLERMVGSRALTVAIRGVAIGFHLALGVAIYWLTRATHGAGWATIAASLYLLNPAALFDVAYWGQVDAAHSLWLVLALGWLEARRWGTSWVALGLAVMTKAQAWILLPLLGVRQLQTFGLRRAALGSGLAALVALLVLFPFVVSGRLDDFLLLPSQIAWTNPAVSHNAHNLWWLVTGGRGLQVRATSALVGPVTYDQCALVLVGGLTVLVLWRSWRASPERVWMLAAYQAFGWFCLTTRAHENHAFVVLPLLAMAMPSEPRLLTLFGAVSASVLLNVVLYDPTLGPRLEATTGTSVWRSMQLVGAAANLTLLMGWTIWLFRPTRTNRGDQTLAQGQRPAVDAPVSAVLEGRSLACERPDGASG